MEEIINLDFDEAPHPDQRVGWFYMSEKNSQRFYMIRLDIDKEYENVKSFVYELDIDHHIVLKNGQKISKFMYLQQPAVGSLDIWPKSYSLDIVGKRQLYHDFDGSGKEDEIGSLADVFKFALELGIKESGMILR